ncbi:endoribonuclease CG2145-like isoform X2 [Phymastichus coffea]|uniref:endoribonuclease CG2145-like isoform X2 n=1 Tax=Phymastichus coffea TaxID=108790 RepID=UPI00273B6387|nr:endoribonuclease CG2145-like isoform X2 [Phymastichus coffea]
MAYRRALLASVLPLIALILLTLVADIEAKRSWGGSRKSGSSGSGWFGSGSRSSSSSKSKPQQTHSQTQTQTHGSYGNPPAYNPSGGYRAGNPPAYSQSNTGYHGNPPPYSQSGGYHAPPPYGSSGGYGGYSGYGGSPNYGGHGFNSNPGHGYNPSYGHSSFSQPSTVVLQQSSRPGIGQLAKEAFVFAGVSAGVNAAVNRILPGGIYGNSFGHGSVSSSGVVPPVSHTQITYNNYYNNASSANGGSAEQAAPAPAQSAAAPVPAPAALPAPAPASPAEPNQAAAANNQQQQQPTQEQNAPSPANFAISDAELQKLTEQLFSKDTNNAFKHITMKLQGQKTDDSTSDDAAENLLQVKSEAYEIPTIKAVLALHDNYQLDVKTKEELTSAERKEEADLLDAFMDTEVMKATMEYLADKGYVPNDEYEFKDTLKRIWFSQFKRIDGAPSSSGFETVFLAEKFDNEIIGLHNWIYFAKQEEDKKLDYLGYIKKLDLGTNGAVVKGRSKLIDTVQPITTIFVGTSPELEMALYTLCFYTRPNNVCPVSLGGANVLIIANRINYFGKDILISAFPDI